MREVTRIGVEIVSCPPLSDALRSEMIATWVEVTNTGGGGIGFLPPVSAADVLPTAEELFSKVEKGIAHLVIARDRGGDLVGWLAVVGNRDHTQGHWAWLKRMHVVPAFQGKGLGDALLEGAIEVCHMLGLSQLYLTTDGQSGPVGFYAARGFIEVGRMPGNTLAIGGQFHDEVYMVRQLAGDESGQARL